MNDQPLADAWKKAGDFIVFCNRLHTSEVSEDLYTICEGCDSVESAADQELIRQQMPVLESEIRLG